VYEAVAIIGCTIPQEILLDEKALARNAVDEQNISLDNNAARNRNTEYSVTLILTESILVGKLRPIEFYVAF